MTVLDEVHAPEVVDLDRRHPLTTAHHRVQLRPPLAQVWLDRKERRIEVVRTIHRATNRVNRDLLTPEIRLAFEARGATDFIEGEQRPGLTVKDRAGLSQKGLQSNAFKVRSGPQLFHVGSSTRRCPTTLITVVSPSLDSRTMSRPWG